MLPNNGFPLLLNNNNNNGFTIEERRTMSNIVTQTHFTLATLITDDIFAKIHTTRVSRELKTSVDKIKTFSSLKFVFEKVMRPESRRVMPPVIRLRYSLAVPNNFIRAAVRWQNRKISVTHRRGVYKRDFFVPGKTFFPNCVIVKTRNFLFVLFYILFADKVKKLI